jgi:hypothetical protein
MACEPWALSNDAADEIDRLRKAVAARREAILELIESKRADANMYDGDYCLRAVADAIKSRGNQR